jgi:hypothetical protein
MHQQSQKLPVMSEMILKLRKCIKTVLKLVLYVHIWQCKMDPLTPPLAHGSRVSAHGTLINTGKVFVFV